MFILSLTSASIYNSAPVLDSQTQVNIMEDSGNGIWMKESCLVKHLHILLITLQKHILYTLEIEKHLVEF